LAHRLCVREVENVRASLASLDCPILQAPHWPNAVAVRNPSFTYADMMAANGNRPDGESTGIERDSVKELLTPA
jgi:hypothetical protein